MKDNEIAEIWRENPIEAAKYFQTLKEDGKLDRGFWEKILNNFRSQKEWTEVEKAAYPPFVEFINKKDYYAAGLMAKTVLQDSPANFDSMIESSVLKTIEEGRRNKTTRLKEVFTFLNSFNYTKQVNKIEEESSYLEEEGASRLIDRVATDIWRELDGSAKPFFEKYIEEETEALIVPRKGKTFKPGHYKAEALKIYNEVLSEDPLDAMNIAKRFELDEEKVEHARDEYRLQNALTKIEEGRVQELNSEELSRLESEDLSEYDQAHLLEKEIGNILTDTYLWRRNPGKAQRAGNEDIVERIKLQHEGRRNGRPSEREKEEIVKEFLMNKEFYAASQYARAANVDVEEELEDAVVDLLNNSEYKEAFAALDSFDYNEDGENIIENVSFYSSDKDSQRVIDKVASDVWRQLDGSARAFFQMYIDSPNERPEGSFEEGTLAKTYVPGSDTPRKGEFYKHDAFFAYEQALREEDEAQADLIKDRFDLEV